MLLAPAPSPAARRDSLSAYRASLMLITCIAILGVDFHAFPRRFAKAETFGTGLMDAGVGSFVAASGLVHGLAAAAGRPSTFRMVGVRALALVALGEHGLGWGAAAWMPLGQAVDSTAGRPATCKVNK